MSTKDKVGYAFPVPHPASYYGMSLRDYFAAKAMQSYISNQRGADDYEIVKWAYEMADAMIVKRGE